MAGGILLLLCVAVLAVAALRVFVVDSAHVHTASMMGTLLPGDFVLVNKLVYGPATPRELPFSSNPIPAYRLPSLVPYRCGDVVLVFRAADDGQPRRLIKRIVGIPGDTLEFRRGVLYRNGRVLPLPAQALQGGIEPLPPLVIPLPGDTITLTAASRSQFGRAIAAETEGAARGVFPPANVVESVRYRVRERWYYLLGDNRGNSLDSRAWGCVASSEVLGKPVVIFWSREEGDGSPPGGMFGVRWDRLGRLVR